MTKINSNSEAKDIQCKILNNLLDLDRYYLETLKLNSNDDQTALHKAFLFYLDVLAKIFTGINHYENLQQITEDLAVELETFSVFDKDGNDDYYEAHDIPHMIRRDR